MGKREFDKAIKLYFDNLQSPVSTEYYYQYLLMRDRLKPSDRSAGKYREYIREYMISEIGHSLSSRIAGGVIYPKGIKIDNFVPARHGMCDVWILLLHECYNHGMVFGDRRILSGVDIKNMDMRLGPYGYRDVGYTSFNLAKAWSSYFNERELIEFASKVERRIGYNSIFRCRNGYGLADKDNPCLDSISILITGKNSAVVHANYRVSNLNRMMLMDLFMIHRFCRIVFPIKMLSGIDISCHFNVVSLDTTMLGWLVNIPGFGRMISKHKIKKNTKFKRIELPKKFILNSKIVDVGINTFINNGFGIEGLNDRNFAPKVSFHKR